MFTHRNLTSFILTKLNDFYYQFINSCFFSSLGPLIGIKFKLIPGILFIVYPDK